MKKFPAFKAILMASLLIVLGTSIQAGPAPFIRLYTMPYLSNVTVNLKNADGEVVDVGNYSTYAEGLVFGVVNFKVPFDCGGCRYLYPDGNYTIEIQGTLNGHCLKRSISFYHDGGWSNSCTGEHCINREPTQEELNCVNGYCRTDIGSPTQLIPLSPCGPIGPDGQE